MSGERNTLTRDQKVENLAFNYPMLLMGSLEGAFATLASKMGEALEAGANAMATALTEGLSGESPKVEAPKKMVKKPEAKVGPQIAMEVNKMFADMRHQMKTEYSTKDESYRKFIANPAFDEGVAIVQRYDFGLPRLTEPLNDEELTSYLILLSKEDPKFLEMLKELSEWQGKVPKFRKEDG